MQCSDERCAFIFEIAGELSQKHKRKITDLEKCFMKPLVKRKYYAYCIMHQEYEFLDGSSRSKESRLAHNYYFCNYNQ